MSLTTRVLASSVVAPVIVACSSPPREAQADTSSPSAAARVDSIVLERTVCLGTCPAYRLHLTGGGLVTFESRAFADSGRTETDRIPPARVSNLVSIAAAKGFFDLPTAIADDAKLCPARATDHPWVHVGVYGSRTKAVADYLGCYAAPNGAQSLTPPIERLRAFEAAIDSAAGTARWLRPAAGKSGSE